MIKKLKNFIVDNNLHGYLVPKNDSYFTEYSNVNNLYKISNFTGSAGFALILKRDNYLFVDGRYTLQANKQSGKNFIICEIPNFYPKDIIKIHGEKIGFDPKLFTENTLKKYFENTANLVPVSFSFHKNLKKKKNYYFYLDKSIVGEGIDTKINRLKKLLNKNKINYLYISASENVCWLLNIRGKDLPHSPLANCKLIFSNKGKIFLLGNLEKFSKLNKKLYKNIYFYNENDFFKIIKTFNKKSFCIDKNTCSIFDQNLIKSKFKIISTNDPIYSFKSIKNHTEINNTKNIHIDDGVALTKFIYWFKKKKNKATEREVEKKLENFRKKSKNYLYPSFDTIAGSGPNGSIIHYKSTNQTNRIINKEDILLLDSGGQYKWGTTDVTRTICSGKVSNKIKNIYTRVLKGHIAVTTCNLKKNYNGHLVDKVARKFLKKIGLNYSHGTGHGVGFFLNVHEGPQAITKNNKIFFKKGMILSNEPGYYLKNKYGIRIENLIYTDYTNNKLVFNNLTYVPIDIDMIDFKMLSPFEKKYMFDYHLEVYSKISKYLTNKERKWLINLIK